MNHTISEIRIGASIMDSDHASNIDATLNEFFSLQRPFLRPGYSLKDLAEDVKIPLHHLSAFINQYYGVHFNDFINRYRVNYFKEMLFTDEWKTKKLEAIAEESGFGNRNTFTIAFKKLSGQSPSEYIKHLQKDRAGAYDR
jgi:YesN/AraC family two-component response regulator